MVERGHVGRAVQIVATNPFEFVLAGAIMGGLVLASAGLLAGPSACGIIAMALKRSRGEPIDVADAFRGFENFGTTLLVGLALAGMVLAGSVFLLAPGLLLASLFGYALPLAVDRRLPAGEAIRQARLLAARDLLAHVIFTAILGVVAVSGAVFLVVGLCATVPVALTALTLAYHDAAYPPATAPGAEGP
jgi:uncharacterized membrane protein